MLTKKDTTTIEELIDRKLEEKLGALKDEIYARLDSYKDELFTKIDAVLGIHKTTYEEHTLLSGRVSEHSDQLEDHEGRIVILEKKKLSH